MSNTTVPIAVTVNFRGNSYLAEIRPTVNGTPSELTTEMVNNLPLLQKVLKEKLEGILQLESLQGYQLLQKANNVGFTFDNQEVNHAAVKTQDVWNQFVDTLHNSAPLKSSDQNVKPADQNRVAAKAIEIGPGIQTSFTRMSGRLSPTEKRELYLKITSYRLGLVKDVNLSEVEEEYLVSLSKQYRPLADCVLNPENPAEILEGDLSAFLARRRAIKEEAVRRAVEASH